MMATASPPLPAALNMQGRRALVTGAASGIGRATASVLAQLGAELVITDRAPLGDTRAEVEALGVSCTEMQGDLTDDAFLTQLLAGDRLHALAHCAAILDGRPWREDENFRDRFHRVMDVNVRVPLQLATLAIDHMADHGGGSIVLIGSVAGRTGGTSPNTPPDYSASKGAVHALDKIAVAQRGGARRAGERRGTGAGADADDDRLQSRPATADAAHGQARGTGMGDRLPLHARRRATCPAR